MCHSNLVVRRGKPEDVVADLIKQLGSVSTVAFQEEVVLVSSLYSVNYDHFFLHFPVILTQLIHHVIMFQVTSEELNVEKKVKDVCAQMKVKVHSCWGTTLYHRDDLPFHHISR